MDFYNDQRYQLSKGFIKDVEYDLTQISWTTSVLNLALKNQEITQDKIGEKVISLYRPFFKQIGYYSRFGMSVFINCLNFFQHLNIKI